MNSKARTTIIWGLYAASLVAILTTFVAIILAYVWRKGDPEAKAVYDKQIRRFWTAAIGWVVGLAVIVVAAATDTAPAGSGMPLLGNIGVLIIVAVQLWFGVASLVSMIISLVSSDGGQKPRQFA